MNGNKRIRSRAGIVQVPGLGAGVMKAMDVPVAMAEAGADAPVPSPGVIPGMVIDIKSFKPVLGNAEGSGTITGRAIKPFWRQNRLRIMQAARCFYHCNGRRDTT